MLTFGLFMVSAVLLIKAYWRTKTFYRFLAAFLILSMLFSPLLQSEHVSAFFQEQQEKKELTEEQRAEAEHRESVQELQKNDWQPNETAESQLKSDIPAARPTNFQRFVGPDTDGDGIVDDEEIEYWETDPNLADTDGDGLDDGLEAYTLGTAPALFDSDSDNISDGLEVGGFTYNSTDWYLDPLEADSNNDGLTDGAECNIWIANIALYDPNAACPDTDGDGTPDIFDGDNDDDGVPDDLDISPQAHSDQNFSRANKFELRLENLEVNEPVMVDLQMRPTNPDNISFTGAVIDWPTGDHDGQITRYLDTTWANTANPDLQLTSPNAANGDVRVVPMLEVIIPATFVAPGHYGNLPVNDTYSGTERPPGLPAKDWLDTDLMEAYGIKVGDFGDPNQVYSDLIMYVPASVKTDPNTGEGVSLNARIPYFPEQGTSGNPTIVRWGNNHEIRLIWIVQMITDECIDPAEDPATCPRQDVLTTINIYDDEWNLAGMSVTEELGVDMAVVYEDPAIDTDLAVDDQLWMLSWYMNGTFLRGKDANMDNIRDMRVDNLEATITSWYSPTAEPLYLAVEPFVDQFDYPDELHRVMMTDTLSILNTAFAGHENAANPTFLFAKETTNRSMNLGDMTSSGNEFTADFDPSIVLPNVTADLSWKPYEYAGGQWTNADPVAYLETLDYHLAQSVFVETAGMTQEEIEVIEGQRTWAQIYYAALYQGLGNVVAAGGETIWVTDADVDENLYTPSWPASTFRGAGYIGQLYANAFVNAVKGTINSVPGQLISTQNFWTDFRVGYRSAHQKVFRSNFQSDGLNLFGHFVDILIFFMTVVAVIGLAYLIAGLATGDKQKIKTGIMILNIVSLVVHVVHGIIIIAALIAFLVLVNATGKRSVGTAEIIIIRNRQ
jgi:hypothetical protein